MRRIAAARRILSQASGLTLIEVIIAVSILGVVAVLVSDHTFEILNFQRTWSEEVEATYELRHAGSWFARDAMNAATTTLTDLAPATSTITMHWTDVGQTFHTAKYSLVGTTTPYLLVREIDGEQVELAQRVVSVGFSRTGKIITIDLEVQAVGDSTKALHAQHVPEEHEVMRQRLGRQEGQAMIIVLAFMLLAIPVTIGALEHAGGLARDSAVKTRILKRGYSSLGAQQYSLHQLLAPGGGATTTTITLNDSTVTTTVTKLDTPPALLPIYALKGRLNASKIVSPTSVSSSATTTYTITITNNKNEPMTPEKIQDEIPGGFSYLTSTSVMRDSSGTIVSTANPSKQIHLLVWTVPSSVSLDPGATMTLSFAATATSTPGLYCNEAFVIPGGEETSSGKTAELTVGTTSASGCRGGLVPVTKTVTPAMVSSNTTTTYTFVITIVNKGEVTVNVKEIKDVTSDGFVYEPGSATSSSSIPPPPPPVRRRRAHYRHPQERDSLGIWRGRRGAGHEHHVDRYLPG